MKKKKPIIYYLAASLFVAVLVFSNSKNIDFKKFFNIKDSSKSNKSVKSKKSQSIKTKEKTKNKSFFNKMFSSNKETKALHIKRINHDLSFYDVEGPKEEYNANPALDISKSINSTKKGDTILINAFSYTCDIIHGALIQALARGVKVIVILDYIQGAVAKYSLYHDQKNIKGFKSLEKTYKNLKVYIHKKPGCAHKKIIIINDNIMFFGSYNFTKGARLKNVECLIKVIVKNKNSEYYDAIKFYTERFYNTVNNIKDQQDSLRKNL